MSRLGLFIADVGGSGRVDEVPGIPNTLTPGQPGFSKDGMHVVYTAWECEPRKLGMIYCYQRPCNLYSASVGAMLASMDKEAADGPVDEAGKKDKGKDKDEQEKHTCLCPSWRLARSARFSPSGDRLVWLSREEGFDTHSGCFRLSSAEWDADKGALAAAPRTLVDVVGVPESDGAFPGLWMDDLPDACWTPDGAFIYLTSAWGSRQSVVKIDAGTGEVERVVGATAASGQDPSTGGAEDASASVLAVGEAGVYVVASSPNSPGGFAVLPARVGGGKAGEAAAILGPAVGGISITSSVRAGSGLAAGAKRALGGVKWRVMSISVPDVDVREGEPPQQDQKIEAVLLMPPPREDGGGADGAPKAAPLVVIPHGGPHGVVPTVFVPSYAFLSATQGLAVLHVNFRGSTGTFAVFVVPCRVTSLRLSCCGGTDCRCCALLLSLYCGGCCGQSHKASSNEAEPSVARLRSARKSAQYALGALRSIIFPYNMFFGGCFLNRRCRLWYDRAGVASRAHRDARRRGRCSGHEGRARPRAGGVGPLQGWRRRGQPRRVPRSALDVATPRNFQGCGAAESGEHHVVRMRQKILVPIGLR